ncbi:universal stress protein [Luteipulveratus mongoliensis]|nr:universal stress protein [Luteipulveratus mongoliensis]
MDRIVVGILGDESPADLHALIRAREIALSSGAGVTVLRLRMMPGWALLLSSAWPMACAATSTNENQAVTRAYHLARQQLDGKGIRWETKFASPVNVRGLIRYATSVGADLIVQPGTTELPSRRDHSNDPRPPVLEVL